MENVGYEPGKIHGSMHGPRYSGDSPLTGAYSLPPGSKFADNFHVFAVEWDASAVRFYVDDHLYETQTPDSIPSSKHWVFDHPFFILLNLAVGGQWPKYQMRPLNSRNRCWWIMCAFTPIHSTQRIATQTNFTVVN